jgi:hypothetical protein
MSLALVIDSTHKYSDVWPLYFGQLNKHFKSDIQKYLFTDTTGSFSFSEVTPVYYNNHDSYRNQLLNCLKQIKEEYILYNSEDYVLFDDAKIIEINNLVDFLKENSIYDFIKLVRGPEKVTPYSELYPNLHIIDRNDSNFFAQQASIWRTDSLIKVFENSNPTNGRMQQEPGGSEICRNIGINGLQYFTGKEEKKGLHHYESLIFPCIITAIVKGKWNTFEYRTELNKLFRIYNIDRHKRGTYEGY